MLSNNTQYSKLWGARSGCTHTWGHTSGSCTCCHRWRAWTPIPTHPNDQTLAVTRTYRFLESHNTAQQAQHPKVPPSRKFQHVTAACIVPMSASSHTAHINECKWQFITQNAHAQHNSAINSHGTARSKTGQNRHQINRHIHPHDVVQQAHVQ